MRQQTLAAQTSFEKYVRESKQEDFFDEMELIVPCARLRGSGRTVLGQLTKRTILPSCRNTSVSRVRHCPNLILFASPDYAPDDSL